MKHFLVDLAASALGVALAILFVGAMMAGITIFVVVVAHFLK